MIWIFIIAVVVWLFFKFARERNEHIEAHVTNYGGMNPKYSLLIDALEEIGIHVTKLGENNVELKSSHANCLMYYIGTNLEILLITNMPHLGCQQKKWVFPDGYPQEKMIEEIANYLNWQVEQAMGIDDKNTL